MSSTGNRSKILKETCDGCMDWRMILQSDLLQAAGSGHYHCLKTAISEGAEDDNTPLILASSKGHLKCVKN